MALASTGCTWGADRTPESTVASAPSVDSTASGTTPVVFAFVCRTGDPQHSETYTTYAAVWEDGRTDCSARRITGTTPSAQQQAALDAAGGEATLRQLAAGCAVSGTAPWTRAVTSSRAATLAAGLLAYCPGHPDGDRLRDALAAYRG
jgi:hypothetical protein